MSEYSLPASREEWLINVQIDPLGLASAPVELRADKELVKLAVSFDCDVLDCVADSLLCDKDFMLDCTCLQLESIGYASPELLGDRQFMLDVAIVDPELALEYASESLLACPQFLAQVNSLHGRCS